MTEKIRHGAWTFEPTPNGVKIERDLNAVQTEFVGTWPWNLFERIANAKPAEKTK